MVAWVLIGASGLLGLNMLRHMNRLYAAMTDEVTRLGPRLNARLARGAFRATGIWLLSISACIGWMDFDQGADVFGGMLGTLMMGLGMTFAPGIFPGASTLLLPAADHKEPIGPEDQVAIGYGPEPDPDGHLRTPEALEEWLREEDLDDDFAESCLEGEHQYEFGTYTCIFCGYDPT